MSSSFHASAGCPASAGLDPARHVNFALGMVLGKDDLEQEFAYLAGHDHWLAREALGYGTLSGLKLGVTGKEIRVEPGVGLTPKGELVHVAPAQCADLDAWLAGEPQHARIVERRGSPPASSVDLYVVLCYAECLGQEVLIPGEPCRSEDDLTAPSRIADDFRLELRLDPPAQAEEDALRDLAHLLQRDVEIGAGPTSADIAGFLDWLRTAAAPASPPASPPTSPPGATFVIARDDACAYLSAALRLWVTELRPRVQADFFGGAPCGCDGNGATAARPRPKDPEQCLLLARLLIPLDDAGRLDLAREVIVDEADRPVLGSLRLLQEWLLCGPQAAALVGGPAGPGVVSADAETVDSPASATAGFDPRTGNIHFQIPRGEKGDPGTPGGPGITDAQAVTLNPGQAATAQILPGTTTLELGIPKGDKGDPGTPGGPGITDAQAVTLNPGQAATAQILPGTTTLELGIPKGDKGDPGGVGGATDEFVHAPEQPPGSRSFVPYHIVAAGRVSVADTRSCNNLKFAGHSSLPGSYDITYDGYTDDFRMMEDSKSQLIVKILPIFAGDQDGDEVRIGFVVVSLEAFLEDVIRLYVARESRRSADREFLEKLELLVEISRFSLDRG